MAPKVLYLAGRMTPKPGEPNEHAYGAFAKGSLALRWAGYFVLNPAENYHLNQDVTAPVLLSRVWDQSYLPLEAEEWTERMSGPLGRDEPAYLEAYREVMKRDIRWIVNEAQGVALLPGWAESRGATFEHSVATFFGLEIRMVSEWLALASGGQGT